MVYAFPLGIPASRTTLERYLLLEFPGFCTPSVVLRVLKICAKIRRLAWVIQL